MTLGDNNVLHKHTNKKHNLILPMKLVHLVFIELHLKRQHLSQDYTLQLMRDKFHWLNMEDNMIHDVLCCFHLC